METPSRDALVAGHTPSVRPQELLSMASQSWDNLTTVHKSPRRTSRSLAAGRFGSGGVPDGRLASVEPLPGGSEEQRQLLETTQGLHTPGLSRKEPYM